MADKKRFEVTAELFLKTSDANKDAKKFADGIRQQLSNIESATDKMTVFQDLVGYIAQVDKNLDALVAKYGNNVKHMFDGLDQGLHGQIEEYFGLSGENLKGLDVLREKLATLTPKSGIKEIRNVAAELNSLYAAIGQEPVLNIDEFKNKATQGQIDQVTSAFGGLEDLWIGMLSRLKDNFNVGGGPEIESFIKEIVREYYDALFHEADELTLDAIQKKLQDRLSLDRTGFKPIAQIFSDLDFGDIEEDDAIKSIQDIVSNIKSANSEFGSTQQSTNAASNGIDQVGQHAVSATEYIRGMTIAIKEMFDVLSKASDIEYKALIGGQDIAVKAAGYKEVSRKTTAEAYLANLMQDTDVDVHSHMGIANASINTADFLQAIHTQYAGLTKMSATIGKNDIVTLDLLKVKAEDAYAAYQKLKEMASAKGLNFFSVEEVNKVFADINPEYANVAQQWFPSTFDDLAEKIFSVKQNFQQAIDPAQRLKNLLTAISGEQIDFSKYDDLLKTLSADNIGDVFNQIAKAENIQEDGKVLQVEDISTKSVQGAIDDIQKQKDAYAELRQTAGLTYQEISQAVKEYSQVYHTKEGQDSDFLKKYFHPSEIEEIRNKLMDVTDGFRDLDGITRELANQFGIDLDDMPAKGLDQIGVAAQKAEEKLKSLYELTSAIQSNELNMTDVEVGQYTERLDTAEKELKELGDQGVITSEELDKVNDAIAKARKSLLDSTTANNPEKVTVPSANSDNATKTVPIGDAIDSADVATETAQLQNLLGILNQVKSAVNAKTTAFAQEYVVVNKAVQLEIDALNRLKESLMTVQSLIQSILSGNIVVAGDVGITNNSAEANTMSASLSTIEKTLNSIYGVLQGFTGIQAENKNSMQYKGTSPKRQTGVQSLNDAANTLNNAASDIIEMAQGPDGVWHVPDDSGNSRNDIIQLADTAQQTENSLIRLGNSAQAAGDKIDKLNSGDVSDILSNGMQARIDRANKLSQAGMSVTRGTLLPSTDEAFNVRLNGGSYDDAFAATWRKIAFGLESVIDLSHVPDEQKTDYALQKFNDILSNIANNFSDTNWKNTKVDNNGPRPDWIHFATKDRGDGFSDEITKKVYGTFSNIGTVSSDFIEKILSELISKGFQGNIKIPGDWTGFKDTDQIVGHAVDDWSFQILYDTFNEYLTKGIFEQIGSGIDIQYSSGKKDSFTNLLTDIYGAAPGETFTVQEIQSIIQSMQESGKYGMSSEEILNKYVAPVLQQRQNTGDQVSDVQKVNDELREQISLREQASNADRVNNDDTSIIQQENEKYREQRDLIQDINNADVNLGGNNGGSGGGSSNDGLNGGASSSDGGYALEKTLQQTNSILNRIASGSGSNGGRTGGSTSRSHYGAGAMAMAEAKNSALWKTLNGNSKLLQSGKIDTAVQAYTEALDELKAQYSSFQNSNPTEKQKEGFIEAKTNCSTLRQEVERLIKSYNTTTTAAKVIDFEPLKDFGNRKNELQDYVNMKFPTAEVGEFNAACTTLSFTIKNADGSFTDAKASINSMGTVIATTAGEVQKSVGLIGSVIDGFKGKWQQLGSYLSSVISWRALFNQVKQGVSYVREIDSALTELKKVTDETSKTYTEFLQTMSKTASQVGSTVKDLTSSASDWSRLGYSLEEAGDLAATTAKLLNVSEFTSVDDATSALVSSLQAFVTEGQDVGERAEEIVDVLNNIGNKYPVATNELAEGLATSGAALVAANNSIEEQVAMLAAGNATIQDISSVASGLKIVAARLRGTTTDDDDDTDSAIKNVSKLQAKIKALTKEANGGEGINIIDESGSYKSTYEIKLLSPYREIYMLCA